MIYSSVGTYTIMNNTQKTLIKRLVVQNGLRYSKLTKGYDFEDNVAYHIKQLKNKNLIVKKEDKYFLSPKGLKLSGKFGIDNITEEEYKTLYVGILAVYKNKLVLRNKSKLLYRIPGDKPRLGEEKCDYIKRISTKELGVEVHTDDIKLNSIQLKTNLTTNGKLLFDNALFVYSVNLNETKYKRCDLRDENIWIELDKVNKLKGVWPEVKIAIKAMKENKLEITEYSFTSDYNLLI